MSFKREKTNDYFLLDTGVENIFIHEHMASAPGDFVKVYLLALMHANLELDITNEEIARHLSMEHEDVLKASEKAREKMTKIILDFIKAI